MLYSVLVRRPIKLSFKTWSICPYLPWICILNGQKQRQGNSWIIHSTTEPWRVVFVPANWILGASSSLTFWAWFFSFPFDSKSCPHPLCCFLLKEAEVHLYGSQSNSGIPSSFVPALLPPSYVTLGHLPQDLNCLSYASELEDLFFLIAVMFLIWFCDFLVILCLIILALCTTPIPICKQKYLCFSFRPQNAIHTDLVYLLFIFSNPQASALQWLLQTFSFLPIPPIRFQIDGLVFCVSENITVIHHLAHSP